MPILGGGDFRSIAEEIQPLGIDRRTNSPYDPHLCTAKGCIKDTAFGLPNGECCPKAETDGGYNPPEVFANSWLIAYTDCRLSRSLTWHSIIKREIRLLRHILFSVVIVFNSIIYWEMRWQICLQMFILAMFLYSNNMVMFNFQLFSCHLSAILVLKLKTLNQKTL